MTIKLSNAKAEEIFFDALCNGLGQLGMYGLLLDVNENQYRDARSQMEAIFRGDMLRGCAD
jgi:hypothetical protein